MEAERIFQADQIKVHPELAKVLREYTKAAIKKNPDDLLDFSWNYFKKKVDEAEELKIKAWKAESEQRELVYDD